MNGMIETLMKARYPLIYVVAAEEDRVATHLQGVAERVTPPFFVWSVTRGIQDTEGNAEPGTDDPMAALEHIRTAEKGTWVFFDVHPYLESPAVVRALKEVSLGSVASPKTVILVSPVLRLPDELKHAVVVDFPLPDVDEAREVVKSAASQLGLKLSKSAVSELSKALQGLTKIEMENVLAKSYIEHKEFRVRAVVEEKKQIIRKSGLLEYYEPGDIKEVGGMDYLKDWVMQRKKAFGDSARKYRLPAPRGLLLVGVQGCGKSLVSKAISKLWNMPLLRLDMSRVMTGVVGGSEQNMRTALQVAESVAPCVLWVDEIEKAFAGLESSGHSDAGTKAGVISFFLTWLQEHNNAVFTVATANNINALPPEMIRKGRYDEVFFVDLPNEAEREEIFAIHLHKRGRDPANYDTAALSKAFRGYSGAEIEQAVISAMYRAFYESREFTTEDILAEGKNTVPLSKTMEAQIRHLREWAKGRTRPASVPEHESPKDRFKEVKA